MARPHFIQTKRRFLPYLAVTLVVLTGIPITEYFHRLVVERAAQVQRVEALGVLAQLRAQIESEVNSVLFLTSGLISYVTVEPNSSPEQWRALAAEIVRSSRHVRNIGLAPGNVIRFVYPLHGNENAIGLDYAKNEQQWPAVERAITLGGTVLAGPLQLVQGGLGLIARTPIYARPDPAETARYWGLASVVIDADSLFADAGIRPDVSGYEIAIIGRDGLGLKGEMVFGSPDVFDDSIARLNLVFPNGHWVLAARAGETVGSYWAGGQVVRLVGYGFLTVLTILLVILVRLYHGSRGEAMHDPLTGLPNRRLLMERLIQLAALHQRTGVGFALYFIDLNRFKPINDHYGHAAGDAVLKEVGRRLGAHVRSTDTVARTGGDEFMVLQPAMGSAAAAQIVADKLEQALAAPFIYHAQELNLSAAVGCSVYPDDADSVDKLIMLADDRMYERKAKSRAEQ
jgi:diguanylate cyclase (GGDEF)-like protein